jgi:DNA-directed RNA polymerase specialized sigma24 family protein
MDLAQRLNEIHDRLIAGSRTASRDLFLTVLDPLRGFLASHFRMLSDEDLHDLATDAIMIYVTAPEQCDTAKSSLWSYLCMVARADALDKVRKLERHERLLDKKVETDVEFWAARAKDVFRGEDAIDARHLMAMHSRKLVSDEVEAKILALILNQEKDTSAFAKALGIDPAGPDAEKTVKQAKDRIQVRIKRLRDEIRR